jgi:hypothetical protein
MICRLTRGEYAFYLKKYLGNGTAGMDISSNQVVVHCVVITCTQPFVIEQQPLLVP